MPIPGGLSINGGDNQGRTGVVNNLINNRSSQGQTSARSKESSPLLSSHGHEAPMRSGSSLVTRSRALQTVALLVVGVIFIFAFYSFHNKVQHTGTVPFPSVDHPLKPTSLWGAARKPYPTGAWWINLMIGEGKNNAAPLPYAIKTTNEKGIEVSYSYLRHMATELVSADLWDDDISVSTAEKITSHQLAGYDDLSVAMEFRIESNLRTVDSALKTHLVRGCPYITGQYTGATPLITAKNKITVVDGLLMTADSIETPTLSGQIFDITVISGQNWLIFASSPISLQWKENELRATKPFTGFIRVAIVPNEKAKKVLVEHWQTYPTGGEVLIDYQDDDTAMITFQWKKKGDGKLLMLALPHHMDMIQGSSLVEVGPYVTMKGPMTGVVGDHWYLKENLTKIQFNAPTKVEDPKKVKAIKKALKDDMDSIENGMTRWNLTFTEPNDPYWAAKQMAMFGRIALMADEFGDQDVRDRALAKTEEAMTPWLKGTNDFPFLYDRTWGGLIINNGLKNPYINFGNTYYNDHHFQYGYFAYTAAILAKLDPAYVKAHTEPIEAIISDIVNHDDDNRLFPIARHKDFFDGHSWASGLFEQNNGKSQESSSEAINAYYGAYLYGLSTGHKNFHDFARLLLAMEIRSTKRYWHMSNSSQIYDPKFAANKMVGVVGALDATCHTWFGALPEFVHAINFMPFTPITEEYLDSDYVTEEYPVLGEVLKRTDPPIEDEWKGFIHLDHAVIDQEAAWEEVMSLKNFDSGNSLSNSLYWVATRPPVKPKSASSTSEQAPSDKSSTESSKSEKGQ